MARLHITERISATVGNMTFFSLVFLPPAVIGSRANHPYGPPRHPDFYNYRTEITFSLTVGYYWRPSLLQRLPLAVTVTAESVVLSESCRSKLPYLSGWATNFGRSSSSVMSLPSDFIRLKARRKYLYDGTSIF